MPNLDKVIKGLECCSRKVPEVCERMGCPYVNEHRKRAKIETSCMDHLMRDALALLKAHEPVEPIVETHWETPSVYDNDVKVTENKCGTCGAGIDKWDKYCRICGRAVKWE